MTYVEAPESPRERGLRLVLEAFDLAPPRGTVEVVEPAEPLWLPEDTEAVLEYLRERSLICSGCGMPRDETMSPEAEDHYTSRAFRCHACAAREREVNRFTSQKHRPEGLYFTVERADE